MRDRSFLAPSGIAAAGLYVATTAAGSLLDPSYSQLHQHVSDLIATGAPTRPLLAPCYLVYDVLTAVFAIGLYRQSDRTNLQVVGLILLALNALAGVMMVAPFAEDPRGIPMTLAGRGHVVFAGLASLTIVVAMFVFGVVFRRSLDARAASNVSFAAAIGFLVLGPLTVIATVKGAYAGLAERGTIGLSSDLDVGHRRDPGAFWSSASAWEAERASYAARRRELAMEGQASLYKIGTWAAVLASVFSIAYDVGQLVEWLGLMGSGGGPERDSTWYGLVVLLVPSLFLGISFVVLMGSVHRHAPAEKKVWSQTGLTFAIMYGTLICMNYFVQLTLVAPALHRGKVPDDIRPFLFHVFNSFTYSVDLLGYSFMSLSTLFVAFVFTGPGIERAARWFLIANGVLVPFIALQTFYHPMIWVASLWGVTLPGSMIALAVLFRRKLQALV